jgi:hypothetical protein
MVSDFREIVLNGFGVRRKMQKKAVSAWSPKNGTTPVVVATSGGRGGEGGVGLMSVCELEEGRVGPALA